MKIQEKAKIGKLLLSIDQKRGVGDLSCVPSLSKSYPYKT